MVLGGVEIPHNEGLDGHSDADVLCHAIADALLGAAAAGDIGVHFPDTDPAWEGASSIALLRRVVDIVREKGYSAVNIDATVIAERPRLAERIPEMCRNIGVCLGLDESAVSVKATTAEKMGALGREEGIAVMAAAMIVATDRGAE